MLIKMLGVKGLTSVGLSALHSLFFIRTSNLYAELKYLKNSGSNVLF